MPTPNQLTSQGTRRQFIGTAATAAIGFWVSGRPARASRSANERLNIGVIGAGGRGAANSRSVESENIVMLCDVNAKNLAHAKKRYPKAATYKDWRKAVDHKGLDAVIVSTTDHTHAFASIWAMNRGLSVYCEKPLAHNVFEARLMQEKYRANKHKLATQMGTQIHATENYRRVVELIQAGAIGPVREVHVWCGRHGLKDGRRPAESQPVPDYLDWDLWLGPAPYRPYHSCYLPGCTRWEQWWDFGNGCLGDMGSHLIDLPFWALRLRDPVAVWAEGQPRREETYPEWLVAHWQHPARGNMPPLTLHWYDGIQRPKVKVPGHDLNKLHKGILFVGDDGMLLADYGYRKLLPAEKFQDYQPPPAWIAPSPGHHKEWLLACKTGSPTLCNFDYSGKLIEHNLLATVAFRVGKRLEWDPAALRATNCPEASRYIKRQYRKGWVLDG